MKHTIDENDLQYIFASPPKTKVKAVKKVLSYLGVFASIFIITFAIVNFQALYNILGYWYKTDIKIEDNNYTPEIISSSNTTNNVPKNKLPDIADNHILIPKIKVDAPVNWNAVNNEANIQKALETGVVHIAGTPTPGEIGNVFITGHSSNYFWAKGDYKNIFSLLNRLVVGDLIYIKNKDKLFIYRTSSIKVVKPTDTSVLKNSQDSRLTLMTCNPVGTSINRLIIVAEQVDPSPKTNLKSNLNSPSTLPSGSR